MTDFDTAAANASRLFDRIPASADTEFDRLARTAPELAERLAEVAVQLMELAGPAMPPGQYMDDDGHIWHEPRDPVFPIRPSKANNVALRIFTQVMDPDAPDPLAAFRTASPPDGLPRSGG